MEPGWRQLHRWLGKKRATVSRRKHTHARTHARHQQPATATAFAARQWRTSVAGHQHSVTAWCCCRRRCCRCSCCGWLSRWRECADTKRRAGWGRAADARGAGDEPHGAHVNRTRRWDRRQQQQQQQQPYRLHHGHCSVSEQEDVFGVGVSLLTRTTPRAGRGAPMARAPSRRSATRADARRRHTRRSCDAVSSRSCYWGSAQCVRHARSTATAAAAAAAAARDAQRHDTHAHTHM